MILWILLVLLNVLENFLSTYLDWVFPCFLNLEFWILILIILESWFLKLDSWILILETWFLNLWILLDSWFFGIIKITLEDIASTISPFLMMTILKLRECIQFLFYRSLIPFSPFLFEFVLNFKVFFENITSWFLKIPNLSPHLATSKRPKCIKHT